MLIFPKLVSPTPGLALALALVSPTLSLAQDSSTRLLPAHTETQVSIVLFWGKGHGPGGQKNPKILYILGENSTTELYILPLSFMRVCACACVCARLHVYVCARAPVHR